MAVIDASLVTEDKARILIGRLLQVQNVAGISLFEPHSRGRDLERSIHSHDLVDRVETMVSIVADDSVGVVHERPVFEASRVERNHWRRPKPGIPVQTGRRIAIRNRRGTHAAHVVPNAHKMNFADLSALDHFRGLGDVVGGAMLRSNLYNPLVAAYRLDHG